MHRPSTRTPSLSFLNLSSGLPNVQPKLCFAPILSKKDQVSLHTSFPAGFFLLALSIRELCFISDRRSRGNSLGNSYGSTDIFSLPFPPPPHQATGSLVLSLLIETLDYPREPRLCCWCEVRDDCPGDWSHRRNGSLSHVFRPATDWISYGRVLSRPDEG